MRFTERGSGATRQGLSMGRKEDRAKVRMDDSNTEYDFCAANRINRICFSALVSQIYHDEKMENK